jgi:hypothetical protein
MSLSDKAAKERANLYYAIERYRDEIGCSQIEAYEFCEAHALEVYKRPIFATYKDFKNFKLNNPRVVEDAREKLHPSPPSPISGEIREIFAILAENISSIAEICRQEGLTILDKEGDTLKADEAIRFATDVVKTYKGHLPQKVADGLSARLQKLNKGKAGHERERNWKSRRATR